MINLKLELHDIVIELYKRLLMQPKSKEHIMEIYVEYLELLVMCDTSLPAFQKYPRGFITGNCYTYALDLKCPLIFQEMYILFSMFRDKGLNFNVGFISANGNKATKSCSSERELLENLYADLEILKIKAFDSEINKEPSHGGYKIYVFKDTLINSSGDFHFVRRNFDGTLSHRNGIDGSIKKIKCLRDVNNSYELVRTLEIVKPNFR